MRPNNIEESELAAQQALADTRMRVASGQEVRPEEYRSLILHLTKNRERRAEAIANARKAPNGKAPKPSPAPPMTLEQMQDLFKRSAQ